MKLVLTSSSFITRVMTFALKIVGMWRKYFYFLIQISGFFLIQHFLMNPQHLDTLTIFCWFSPHVQFSFLVQKYQFHPFYKAILHLIQQKMHVLPPYIFFTNFYPPPHVNFSDQTPIQKSLNFPHTLFLMKLHTLGKIMGKFWEKKSLLFMRKWGFCCQNGKIFCSPNSPMISQCNSTVNLHTASRTHNHRTLI